MDAFPGYTYFDQTRKVLCAMQIVEDAIAGNPNVTPVFPHNAGEQPNTGGIDTQSDSGVSRMASRAYTIKQASEEEDE